MKIKGKHGSNDPFVTIGLGKEKFQTSVVEKTTDSVEWMEQCELSVDSFPQRKYLTLLFSELYPLKEILQK